MKNLGGSPVPVDWAETFSAIQQGTVDGLVSQYLWLDATKLSEVIKYITEVNVNMPCGIIFMNLKVMEPVASRHTSDYSESGLETEPLGMRLDKEQDGQYKERLKRMGIAVYEPNPAEKHSSGSSGSRSMMR